MNDADIIESDQGVVAADDARCSEIGASMLRQGGHAVDAAVATAFCVGVVNPMASGIGGGAFMIVRSSSTSQTQAFDMRETASLAASQVHNSLFLQIWTGSSCVFWLLTLLLSSNRICMKTILKPSIQVLSLWEFLVR